jgi:hypothetical protein
VHACCAKATASLEGSQQWGIATAAHANTKRLSGIDEIEFKAFRVAIEPIGESAQEPYRGGPQNGKPKLFDIGGSGIVAELVDDGVRPCIDCNRRCWMGGIADESHGFS